MFDVMFIPHKSDGNHYIRACNCRCALFMFSVMCNFVCEVLFGSAVVLYALLNLNFFKAVEIFCEDLL